MFLFQSGLVLQFSPNPFFTYVSEKMSQKRSHRRSYLADVQVTILVRPFHPYVDKVLFQIVGQLVCKVRLCTNSKKTHQLNVISYTRQRKTVKWLLNGSPVKDLLSTQHGSITSFPDIAHQTVTAGSICEDLRSIYCRQALYSTNSSYTCLQVCRQYKQHCSTQPVSHPDFSEQHNTYICTYNVLTFYLILSHI